MFVATTATIISGAVVREEFNGYLLITILATGIIYPLVGHWAWSSSYLANMQGAEAQLLIATGTVRHTGWLSTWDLSILLEAQLFIR